MRFIALLNSYIIVQFISLATGAGGSECLWVSVSSRGQCQDRPQRGESLHGHRQTATENQRGEGLFSH